ncbi:MAG TPA: Gfo/Idh/MocA family oxidoreductase [Streptosporangiaceae bacterium]
MPIDLSRPASVLGPAAGPLPPSGPLRFGLVGTGHWASLVHAPALASTEGISLAAIWGRDAQAAADLAARYQAGALADFDAFLAEVDAVCFAVPPDVQADLAIRAAAAGKHLLLEKPIATSEPAARALTEAVRDAGVASVVFFTARFQPDVRDWLTDVTRNGPWSGGNAVWLGSALAEGNPFNTPWRRDKGGLWDLAPHLVSLLWASLGPVRDVTADACPGDVTHLVLHHEGGASSTVTVTLCAAEAAAGVDLFLWGTSGRSHAPGETSHPQQALRVALTELAACARSGQVSHDCDTRFGYDVAVVLARAQRQISAIRRRQEASSASRRCPW